jgi:hypothetical protein
MNEEYYSPVPLLVKPIPSTGTRTWVTAIGGPFDFKSQGQVPLEEPNDGGSFHREVRLEYHRLLNWCVWKNF